MLLYMTGTLLGVALLIGIFVAIVYFIALAYVRRPVPIDPATKQIMLKGGMAIDYRTCMAVSLCVSVGRQVAYSLVFQFPDGRHWSYLLTDNHADTPRVRANKQKVAMVLDELQSIPETRFQVVTVARMLGALFGQSYIEIGTSEAKRYLYAPRAELNEVYRVLKKTV